MAERELSKHIVVSGDGSHTIKIPEIKEHYHSNKGAIQESLHVFISKGLNYKTRKDIRVLEIGFGTGLNALLTALENTNGQVEYETLEPYPLDTEIVSKLNYPDLLEQSIAIELFQNIHDAAWEKPVEITENFVLKKIKSGFETHQSEKLFDVIYYDAFAPHAQPELWEPHIWVRAKEMLKPNGVLVTYCAKGQVRRDMQAAGLLVERLEGPPGKREMLRAINHV